MSFARGFTAAIAAALLGVSLAAFPADHQEMDAIRKEIKALKDAYEARIQALEKRLEEAEAKSAQQSAAPAATEAAATKPAYASPKAQVTNNAFNPAISLILDGKYQHLQRDPETYHIGGFIPGGDEFGPGSRSFSLGESELTISANVDPYFYGAVTAAITGENEVEVEEAYFSTLALPTGLTLKGGRFFSGIGYLNERHAHAWDFVDNPLVYQAFFAPRLGQDGLQLKWLAPTPLFLELGLEAGNGKEFPGSEHDKTSLRSWAAFAHLGGDVGASNSWRAGLSYTKHKPQAREYADVESTGTDIINAFTGDSKVAGVDFVWKWAPNGNAKERNFKFQTEYFRRKESGTLAFDTEDVVGLGLAPADYDATQKGWYAQAVYQFAARWRAGLRYDQLDSGTPSIGYLSNGTLGVADFPLLGSHKPKRMSLMVDFSPSEFSRLRLQFAQDKARFSERDNQVYLQYIMSLGPHGAHKF